MIVVRIEEKNRWSRLKTNGEELIVNGNKNSFEGKI